MTTGELPSEIRRRLEQAHGARLCGVVLYGSEARGQARPDSGVDVLVLLDDPVDYGFGLQANLDALYPLSWRSAGGSAPSPSRRRSTKQRPWSKS